MLERARARIADQEWDNITLVQADAARPLVKPEQLDGVIATTAVSATPAVQSTVEHVYEALRPGTRFSLYEIRLVPSGIGTALNPLIGLFYRLFGNWNSDEDVVESLHTTFDRTEIARTVALGTNYLVVAEKARLAG